VDCVGAGLSKEIDYTYDVLMSGAGEVSLSLFIPSDANNRKVVLCLAITSTKGWSRGLAHPVPMS